jgi:translation initiation factor IF-3
MNFNGRQITYSENGRILMLKFINELMEIGKPESLPILEGKRMWVVVSPK